MYLKFHKQLCLIMTMLGTFQLLAQCPNLIWSDEFTDSQLNTVDWNYQTGNGCDESICGWGNNEEQYYKQENVTLSNGILQITAKKERVRGNQYTSGRINTKSKHDFTYGRFEARVKLPQGGGLWPAFWMLSTNEPYGTWPQSGEIDVMEFIGHDPTQTLGYIHYGDLYPGNQSQGTAFKLNNGLFYDDFHEFAIEWQQNEIKWFVDGNLFQTKTPADLAPYNWPFDHDFHILLNVAVGGNLGGDVDNSIFPATMEVDYVRVYDGFRPYISGNRLVENMATTETYTIGNVSPGTNVSWTVPSGALITSGQGSSSITIDWGSTGGDVVAMINDCSSETLVMNVGMQPPYIKDFSFENFDEPENANLLSSDGLLTEVSNPAPNAINGSALCAQYIRNSSEQYDVINYGVSNISDASTYVNGDSRFYLDVHTSAPIGTQIIVQLETPEASTSEYPAGRHSRYFGQITQNGDWHRVYFTFGDRPDPSALDNAVTSLLVLFNSNSFSGDTYFFDNLDSYIIDKGGSSNTPPNVNITAPVDGSTYNENTIIQIEVDASDLDGSIAQVEFFIDGNSIGVDVTSPFSTTWTIPAGMSSITAVAMDNEGASTTSGTVTVSGQATSGATELYVNSIATGTQGAGQGKKFGTALIEVLDNNGTPVAGAEVYGTFSGTFNESSSGITAVSYTHLTLPTKRIV